MSPPRLYCPTLTAGLNPLPEEESHHAIAALRVRLDQKVTLFDGQGGEAVGRVRRLGKQHLEVEVPRISRRPFELTCQLTLAVAMPKAHRQGYLIEKCTELGVAAVWPITTERSVVRSRRGAVEKWRRRAIEAAKQSDRCWVPQLPPPQTFEESLERAGESASAAIMDPGATASLFRDFLLAAPDVTSVIVWVGPEGGWSDDERRRAAGAGAKPTKLGPTVLRTETAAVAVCAAIAVRWSVP